MPDAFGGDFGVMLFYRGSWCPYCNAQLRAFQRASGTLAGPACCVAALSVDDEATTAALIAKNGLTFPVGFGADARAVAEQTGAFVNPGPVYLQSTGFVLDPAGNVVVSVYSSGAIGRLVPRTSRASSATSASMPRPSPSAQLPPAPQSPGPVRDGLTAISRTGRGSSPPACTSPRARLKETQ